MNTKIPAGVQHDAPAAMTAPDDLPHAVVEDYVSAVHERGVLAFWYGGVQDDELPDREGVFFAEEHIYVTALVCNLGVALAMVVIGWLVT